MNQDSSEGSQDNSGFANHKRGQQNKAADAQWNIVKGKRKATGSKSKVDLKREQHYQHNNSEQQELSSDDYQNQVNRKRKDSRFEIKTRYPHTRYQLAKELRIPPETGQQAFGQEQCEEIIKDHLDDMQQYDYDFIYSSKLPFDDDPKATKRKVKIKIFCKDCNKSWTSIVGTLQAYYRIQRVEHKKLVNFRVRIYRMQCQICSKMGEAMVYQSQMHTFAKIFCLIIAERLENLPLHKHKDNRYKMEEVHHHREQLCEACRLGKCFAIPKPK